MIIWDEKKRRQVIKDHGVDFEKVADIFDDGFAIHEADRQNTDSEEKMVDDRQNIRVRVDRRDLHFSRRRHTPDHRAQGRDDKIV